MLFLCIERDVLQAILRCSGSACTPNHLHFLFFRTSLPVLLVFILKKGTKKPPSWWHYCLHKGQTFLMHTMCHSVENSHRIQHTAELFCGQHLFLCCLLATMFRSVIHAGCSYCYRKKL